MKSSRLGPGWIVLLGAIIGFLLGWVSTRPAHSATLQRRCVISNQDCFVLRAPAGHLSATRRMDKVNERLAYILGCENLRRVVTRPDGEGNTAIYVGNSLLVTITWVDAEVTHESSSAQLARVWVSNLKSAFAVQLRK